MDEPGWEWPAWRFGLKRHDLFGRLHDQYNTFASSIQDPEAFHHDVYEIAHAADTPDDFHRLLADRKAQRLRELNESLESAAVEIIANPKLIGSEQWQYALQLFRTRSLDSLVRYFASYLPEGHYYSHPHHHASHPYEHSPSSSTGSSFAETCSVDTASSKPSTIDDIDVPTTCFFPDDEDRPIMTHEPFTITNPSSLVSISSSASAAAAAAPQLPPSPRSMTMRSDASVGCPLDDDIDVHDFIINTHTTARTFSFSGSESDRFVPSERGDHYRHHHHHDHHTDSEEDEALETSQSDFETPITSESDLAGSHSSFASIGVPEPGPPLARSGKSEAGDDIGDDAGDDDSEGERHVEEEEEEEEEYPSAQLPLDMFDALESETPTPRPETHGTSYIESTSSSSLYRAARATSPRLRRREASPLQRRSPEESLSRIQKPGLDAIRARSKARRRAD